MHRSPVFATVPPRRVRVVGGLLAMVAAGATAAPPTEPCPDAAAATSLPVPVPDEIDVPLVVYVRRPPTSRWESYATGALSIVHNGATTSYTVVVGKHRRQWRNEVQADGWITGGMPPALLPVLLPLAWKRAARVPDRDAFTCAPGLQVSSTAVNGEFSESCNELDLMVLRADTTPPQP